jgi:beta-lactamase class C
MKWQTLIHAAIAFFGFLPVSPLIQAANGANATVKEIVDATLGPVMAKHNIPGMAVGVVFAGEPYLLSYGVASRATRQPVTPYTLFEIGSVSKTFTATLATYAQASGTLSLSDKTGKYLPSLRGHPFGDVSLIHLGTHTSGGLPLQVPDEVNNNDQLLTWLQNWQPRFQPGTHRTYANPSIGTLGLITAKAIGQDFTTLIQGSLLPALGLNNTYIDVPSTQLANYAQGYTRDERPTRMSPGVLSSEAYGIKTNVADLTRFIAANMNLIKLKPLVQQAITDTHTGYFRAGGMTQDLIWEQYPYPVELKTLLQGNSMEMILNPTPVTEIMPPQAPRKDVWINKTGSTNGFGTYVAFIPDKQLAIVLLANKNYPNEERVSAAYQILTSLADTRP